MRFATAVFAVSISALPAVNGDQYAPNKLHLLEAHRLATGNRVLVAVIDSAIDVRHPDLAGAIAEQFDAVDRQDRPHVHGTGMAGAIVAHRKEHGPIRSVNELDELPHFRDQSTLERQNIKNALEV